MKTTGGDTKRKSFKFFKKVSLAEFKKSDEEEEEEKLEELQNTATKLLKINARRSETLSSTTNTPISKDDEIDEENEGKVKIIMSEDPLNATLKGKGKALLPTLKKKNGTIKKDEILSPVDEDEMNKPKYEDLLNNIVVKPTLSPRPKLPETSAPTTPTSPTILKLPDQRPKSGTTLRVKSQMLIGNDLNALLNSSEQKHKSLKNNTSTANISSSSSVERRKKKKQKSIFLQLHNDLEKMMNEYEIPVDE